MVVKVSIVYVWGIQYILMDSQINLYLYLTWLNLRM